jgi:hypothetical protein
MNGLSWLALVTSCWLAAVITVNRVVVWRWRRSLIACRLRLPREVTTDQAARWLARVQVLTFTRWPRLAPRWPVAVEITATTRGIQHTVMVRRSMLPDLLGTVKAAIPGARLDETPDQLRKRWRVAVEARLSTVVRPLAADRAEETSRHVLSVLSPLSPGESIGIQWILVGGRSPRRLRKAARGTKGVLWQQRSRDLDAERDARLKQQDPLLWATCRIGIRAARRRRAVELYRRVWAALRGLNTPRVAITRRVVPTRLVAWRLTRRAVPLRRWPQLLAVREAAGLIGVAAGEGGLHGVEIGAARTLPPPSLMPSSGLVVARSNYPGVDQLLCLERTDRLRHLWVLGPTGAGKSTLLHNMITQDIRAGDGLVVIDARGDLTTDVLNQIPPDRADDVIILDASRRDRVIGFNPLNIGGEDEQARELAAAQVLHVLRSVYAASWGPRTADILRAGLLTLVNTRAPDDSAFTLCELPELITNSRFRAFVTHQPLPAALGGFWRWYEELSDAERAAVIGPVLNKLRTFTLSTPLRLMLGQSTGMDLAGIFTHHRIVLVPLKKGLLGEETTALIGSLIMAGVWQATLRRADTPPEDRRPAWLYADEFQEIMRLPLDLADMLAQARGLGLGLVLAHQHLGQLPPDLKHAVLSTTRSQVVFQVEHEDARTLAPRYAPLTADDLTGLDAYEVAFRPCVGGNTQPPATGVTLFAPSPITNGRKLAKASRVHYGLPRSVIDQHAAERIMVPVPGGARPNRAPVAGGP